MDFLKKIQNSSNEEKKTWLIILSGITMVIVVMLWFFYMSAVVFKIPSEFEKEEVTIDFWPTLKTGVAVTVKNISSAAGNGISTLLEKIKN